MLYHPSGCEGPSPQRRKYTKKYNQIGPSSSRTSPTRWGNHCGPDDRDCHTQHRRTSVSKRVATQSASGCLPGPDIATVWTCPTPVYTNTEGRCTNNTQRQGHRAVRPSATHMSTKKRHLTKPSWNATTATQTHSDQSTMWLGTHRTDDKFKGRKKEEVHEQRVLC